MHRVYSRPYSLFQRRRFFRPSLLKSLSYFHTGPLRQYYSNFCVHDRPIQNSIQLLSYTSNIALLLSPSPFRCRLLLLQAKVKAGAITLHPGATLVIDGEDIIVEGPLEVCMWMCLHVHVCLCVCLCVCVFCVCVLVFECPCQKCSRRPGSNSSGPGVLFDVMVHPCTRARTYAYENTCSHTDILESIMLTTFFPSQNNYRCAVPWCCVPVLACSLRCAPCL